VDATTFSITTYQQLAKHQANATLSKTMLDTEWCIFIITLSVTILNATFFIVVLSVMAL
jgi:hypothetical protein